MAGADAGADVGGGVGGACAGGAAGAGGAAAGGAAAGGARAGGGMSALLQPPRPPPSSAVRHRPSELALLSAAGQADEVHDDLPKGEGAPSGCLEGLAGGAVALAGAACHGAVGVAGATIHGAAAVAQGSARVAVAAPAARAAPVGRAAPGGDGDRADNQRGDGDLHWWSVTVSLSRPFQSRDVRIRLRDGSEHLIQP